MPVQAVLIGTSVSCLLSPFLAAVTIRMPRSQRLFGDGGWHGRGTSASRVGLLATVSVLLTVAIANRVPFALCVPIWGVALCGVVLSVIDYEHRRLPNQLVLIVGSLGLLTVVTRCSVDAFLSSAVAATSTALAFGTVALASQRSFGTGDAKIAASLALTTGALGWSTWLQSLLFAALFNAVAAVVILAVYRSGSRKFAAGPGIIAGALLAICLN
ncbi:hypothetical protein D5S17_14720 [Pseudonocardiaceae bacterium YIM PH 21723]|nr:hypothetical protein D5S17_14720 [Pseudonocardiaceae bacterium YIM PH 21723]